MLFDSLGLRLSYIRSVALLLFAFFSPFAFTQTPVFRSEAALLELEVRVTRNGQPVPNLRAEDFQLSENGVPREITVAEYVPGPRAISRAAADADSDAMARTEPVYMLIKRAPGSARSPAVREAVREFLERNLLPGVQISLDGLPFSASQSTLLAQLDLPVRGGAPQPEENRESGDAAQPSTEAGATPPSTVFADSSSGPNSVTMADPNAFGAGGMGGGAMMSGAPMLGALGGASPGASSPFADPDVRNQRVQEMQISFYQRQNLRSLIGLIQSLGGLPGRKVIVLFQGATQFAWSEAKDLFEQLRTEALRHRVSIYTVDARGLIPGSTASSSPGAAQGAAQAFFNRATAESGLMMLADLTGGKYVGGTNNFGNIFQHVYDDLDGYYVLGYYPPEPALRNGKERRIAIRVNQPGVDLSYRKRYYERKPWQRLSDAEKQAELLAALQSDSYAADFPLAVTADHFRGEGQATNVMLTVGMPAFEAEFREEGQLAYADVRMALRVFGPGSPLPVELNQVFREEYNRKRLEVLRNEPFEFIQHHLQLPIPPGRWRLQVVLRDENTGRTGVYRTDLVVPDLRTCLAASSLLLTRYVEPVSRKVDPDAPPLPQWANVRFLPDAGSIVRRGQRLYGLFEVEQVERPAIQRGAKVQYILRRGRDFVKNVPFEQRFHAYDAEQQKARFYLELDTAKLEEGVYVLYAVFERGDVPESVITARNFVVAAP